MKAFGRIQPMKNYAVMKLADKWRFSDCLLAGELRGRGHESWRQEKAEIGLQKQKSRWGNHLLLSEIELRKSFTGYSTT